MSRKEHWKEKEKFATGAARESSWPSILTDGTVANAN
jgi:hypothetical protein